MTHHFPPPPPRPLKVPVVFEAQQHRCRQLRRQTLLQRRADQVLHVQVRTRLSKTVMRLVLQLDPLIVVVDAVRGGAHVSRSANNAVLCSRTTCRTESSTSFADCVPIVIVTSV